MKIKVCGITRSEDARLAVELGAWALGFVLDERSPRAIAPERIRAIRDGLEVSKPKTVGVFVNADLARIQRVVELSGIDTVQLHGDEPPEFCRILRETFPDLEVIKALRLRSDEDLVALAGFRGACHRILVDAYVPGGARGGTGVMADWDLAARARSSGPVILAGGLRPENIRAAIENVRPDAVDVSSGLEDAPGIKSAEKMRKFFENAATMESS